MNSYIRTKKEEISQFYPSAGKSEKSLIYAKKVNILARKYAILRKSILLPKSMPIIAKKYNYAEKYSFIAKRVNYAERYSFIAKRFNYAELYQLSGHYTLTHQGLEPSKIQNIFPHIITPQIIIYSI